MGHEKLYRFVAKDCLARALSGFNQTFRGV